MIPFGEWLPDRPALESPGATIAKNVIPVAGGYAPFQTGVIATNALDGPCKGAASFKQTDGTSYNFAGDATKLYLLSDGSWIDASAKVYSVLDFNFWEYAQFGSIILAANGSDKLQKIRAGAAVTFEEILDSPICQFIAIVKDFVVVGPVSDSGVTSIQWSARNNVDAWTPTIDSSGIQALIEGGPLKGITGGDFGTILQETTVTRMNFVGGDLVFSLDVIESARGCFVAGSVVQLGSITYYWSEEGVEAFAGTGGRNIGQGRVNNTLFDRLDFDNLDLVTATIDPIRRLILWAYPVAGVVSRILIYNVGENQFSDVEMTVQVLMSSRDETISIDDISGSIDASPLTGWPTVTSLDDPLLLGGRRRLAAFNTSNQMETLDGANMAATISTGEFIFSNNGTLVSDGKKIHSRRLRGAVDGIHTVTVVHRSTLQASLTTDTALTLESDGSVAPRVSDRYQRFQIDTAAAAAWNFNQGIDFEEATKGGR